MLALNIISVVLVTVQFVLAQPTHFTTGKDGTCDLDKDGRTITPGPSNIDIFALGVRGFTFTYDLTKLKRCYNIETHSGPSWCILLYGNLLPRRLCKKPSSAVPGYVYSYAKSLLSQAYLYGFR